MTPGFTSDEWVAKALAGLVLGFTLSAMLAGAGIVAVGGHAATADTVQLAMWSVAPGWAAVLGACFLFRDGRAAWGWLALANLLAAGLLLIATRN